MLSVGCMCGDARSFNKNGRRRSFAGVKTLATCHGLPVHGRHVGRHVVVQVRPGAPAPLLGGGFPGPGAVQAVRRLSGGRRSAPSPIGPPPPHRPPTAPPPPGIFTAPPPHTVIHPPQHPPTPPSLGYLLVDFWRPVPFPPNWQDGF